MNGKTEIKYYVEECTRSGKKLKNEYIILVNEHFDEAFEADNFLDGSDVIRAHVDKSELGFLLDWQIISVEYKSACALAAERVLKWPIWEQRKQRDKKWKASLDKIEHNQGWLDPNGKFYPLYGIGVHNEFAVEYLNNLHGRFKWSDDSNSYGYDILERRGWIRILGCGGGGVYNSTYNFKPSRGQIEFLGRFALQFNKNYDEIIASLTDYSDKNYN